MDKQIISYAGRLLMWVRKPDLFPELQTQLRTLATELEGLDPMERTILVSDLGHTLNQVRTEFEGPAAAGKKQLNNFPVMRSLYDRIFRNLLPPATKGATRCSQIFDAFIRGITYFVREQPADIPVYHRLASCGPSRGGEAFRAQYMRCSGDISTEERTEIEQRIRTCYLERCIYNSLWSFMATHIPCTLEETSSESPTQDLGHRHYLELTRQDFESCFPNTTVNVSVAFHRDVPKRLEVEWKERGFVTTRTIYVRDVRCTVDDPYLPMVQCYQTEDDGVTWKFRIQTFFDDTDNPWMMVDGPPSDDEKEPIGFAEAPFHGAPVIGGKPRKRSSRRARKSRSKV